MALTGGRADDPGDVIGARRQCDGGRLLDDGDVPWRADGVEVGVIGEPDELVELVAQGKGWV